MQGTFDLGSKSKKVAIWCPYCNRRAKLTSSKRVYGGRDYGPIYLCEPCGAWVGCHKGTTNPLGTLANEQLRAARKAAHTAIDPLWKNSDQSRASVYKWLASQMGIARKTCHVAMFNEDQCLQAIEICHKYNRGEL
jgi:hypothetical protein